MRAHFVTGRGIDGIELRSVPDPTPGPGEVAVRVEGRSLNFRDLLVARSTAERIPLSDGSGEVVATGEGVTTVAVGDRVVGCFFSNWVDGRITAEVHDSALGGAVDGMLAEVVVLPEHGVVPAPRGWTSEQAATLPCAALTAWNALVEGQHFLAGQTVLLLGTGGVSVFGLQFAKLLGGRAIITSSSHEKLAHMADLGADVTINYATTPEWDRVVLDATDGEGVDLVLEVGGEHTMARSMRCTRYGGQIALIGMVSGLADVNPFPLLSRSVSLRGVYVGSRRMFREMNAAIDISGLKPLIDRSFPFEGARNAYRHLRSQTHMGKVVIGT